MVKSIDRIKDLDLYELLGLPVDADTAAVKKAYRKRALHCHPDKNPDNPNAAEEFHRLSDAYEVLTDEATRNAYDNILKARKANELRNRKLDAKRRKLKDDLEAREKAAQEAENAFETVVSKKTAEERLAEEIERLRKEGSRRLEEEQELMRREIEAEAKKQHRASQHHSGEGVSRLKLKWKDRAFYDESKLRMIFEKYGRVKNVVILEAKKKDGRMNGLIEMESSSAAVNAVKIERGFEDCPLKIKLVDGQGKEVSEEEIVNMMAPAGPPPVAEGLVNETDFESLVMRKLRQEEMRKQEIQRIMEEDAKEEEEERKRTATAKKL